MSIAMLKKVMLDEIPWKIKRILKKGMGLFCVQSSVNLSLEFKVKSEISNGQTSALNFFRRTMLLPPFLFHLISQNANKSLLSFVK